MRRKIMNQQHQNLYEYLPFDYKKYNEFETYIAPLKS